MSNYYDALPYYDKQIDAPPTKAAANALIEAELRQTQQIAPDDPRLPPLIDVFPKSRQLADLLADYPANPIQGIDPSKYAPPSLPDEASLQQWEEAEKRGRIGEGHMSIRHDNVSLLTSHGPNAWLIRNYQLNSQLTELQATLVALKERVTDVNRSRRVYQEDAGKHLSTLEGRWQDLVGGTVQLEMACKAMEGEVHALRRREEELRLEVEGTL